MKFKISILILLLLGFFFVMKVFLSDFLMDNHKHHIIDKYFVMKINGDYNLMHKEEHGYSLIVPSVLNVYIKQKEIIVLSNLGGDNFINNDYKNKYTNRKKKYYYYYNFKEMKVKEISEEEFFKQIKNYKLAWKN